MGAVHESDDHGTYTNQSTAQHHEQAAVRSFKIEPFDPSKPETFRAAAAAGAAIAAEALAPLDPNDFTVRDLTM